MTLEFKKVSQDLEIPEVEKIDSGIQNVQEIEPVVQEKKKRGRPKKVIENSGVENPKKEAPKKRGRPKGSTKNKTKPEEKKEFNPDEELEAIRKQFDLAESEESKIIKVEAETVPTKEQICLINGYTLLIVCDVFFPFVISYFMKGRLKKNNKTKKDLKLTATEKKELEPLADAAAKEISLSMSATQTFALTMLFMYADKVD